MERRSIFPEIRFTWSFGPKSDSTEGKKSAAHREAGNQSSTGKKNRYHIAHVSNHTASEEDVQMEQTSDTDTTERR